MNKDRISHEKTNCPHCGTDVFIRYQKKPLQILGLVDSDGVATNTKSNPDIIAIYEYWNTQKIIVHRNMTPDIAKSIKAELKDYSEEEILQAIKNYAEIQKGDQYWFDYAWTLKDFLKRGLSKFLDLEIAKRNYLTKERTHKGKPLHKWCRACGYKSFTDDVNCPECASPLEKDFKASKYGHMVKR